MSLFLPAGVSAGTNAPILEFYLTRILSFNGEADMLIKKNDDILPSEITPETLYHNRREFMRNAALVVAGAAAATVLPKNVSSVFAQDGKSWKPANRAHLTPPRRLRRTRILLRTIIFMNSESIKMTLPAMPVR